MLGLYIHIPFCVRKCRYCDFLSAPACDSEREAYLKSLHGQIKAIGERLRQKKSGTHIFVATTGISNHFSLSCTGYIDNVSENIT